MEQNKKRGRRPIGQAPMTGAERNKRYREKLEASGIKVFSIMLNGKTNEIINRYCEMMGVSRTDHITTLAEVAITEWAIDVEPRLPELAAWIEQRNKKGSTNGDPK